ncbi:MAG: hypothetical protein KC591_09255, partial [Gemmatimonadetes bacterium]|nr:hypothetical protein [Gemmatimonadota bacterium]
MDTVTGFATPEEAALELEIPLLGTLPPPLVEDGVITPMFPADERARREYHRAADRLLLSPHGRGASVGLLGDVSSAHRAVVASLLGASVAAERTAILVDADVRAAHLSFDDRDRAQEGLVDVLRYGVRSPRVVAPTQTPGLNLLPVGSGTTDLEGTFGSDAVRALFDELARTGDLVLVNGPDLRDTRAAARFLAEIDAWILVHEIGASDAAKTRRLRDTFGREKCVGILAILRDEPVAAPPPAVPVPEPIAEAIAEDPVLAAESEVTEPTIPDEEPLIVHGATWQEPEVAETPAPLDVAPVEPVPFEIESAPAVPAAEVEAELPPPPAAPSRPPTAEVPVARADVLPEMPAPPPVAEEASAAAPVDDAIERALSALDDPAPIEEPAGSRGRGPWIGVAIAAALVLAAVLGWNLMRGRPAKTEVAAVGPRPTENAPVAASGQSGQDALPAEASETAAGPTDALPSEDGEGLSPETTTPPHTALDDAVEEAVTRGEAGLPVGVGDLDPRLPSDRNGPAGSPTGAEETPAVAIDEPAASTSAPATTPEASTAPATQTPPPSPAAVPAGPRFGVHLTSQTTEAGARQDAARFQRAGYPTVIRHV